jgi:hypothetical protein
MNKGLNMESTINNNLGHLFECKMLKRLLSTNMFDEIYTENDLINQFGFNASSIDFMLICKNKIIFIQCKYRLSRRRENHGINNFLNSIEFVLNIIGKDKYTFGVWASRRPPFNDNITRLENRKVFTVVFFDNMDTLVDETTMFILKQLNYSS